jgi:hypothetical protein
MPPVVIERWTDAVMAAFLVLTTIALVTGEILNGHVVSAVYFGFIVGGGTLAWWRLRRELGRVIDQLGWPFLMLAFWVAVPRWAVIQTWLRGG